MFNTTNSKQTTNPYLSHQYFSQHYTHPLAQTVISQQLLQQQQYQHHKNSNIWRGHDRLSELIRKSYQQLQGSNDSNIKSYIYDKQKDIQPLYEGPLYKKKPVYGQPLQSVNHSVYQRNNNYNKDYQYQQQNNYKNYQEIHDTNVVNQSPQHSDNECCYQFIPKQSIPLMFSNYQWNKNDYEIRNGNSHTNQQNTKDIDNNHFNRLNPISQPSSIIKSQQPQQRPGFIKQQRKLNTIKEHSPKQQGYSVSNNGQQQSVEIIKDGKHLLMRQCDEYHIGLEPNKDNKFGQDYHLHRQQHYYDNNNEPFSSQTNHIPSKQLQKTLDTSTDHFHYHIVPTSIPSSTMYMKQQQHFLTTTNPDSSLKQDSFLQQQQSDKYYSLRVEYERDLFEFIKKQLIKVTVENKEWIQNQDCYLQEEKLSLQQQTNRQLYSLYTQTKQSFTRHKQQQHLTLQSLHQQITLLNQQLTFYRQHSAKVSTSITVKIHKQQQLYFRHKVNLQNVIIRNNQTLSQLNRLLQDTKMREYNIQEKGGQSQITINDNKSKKSLHVLMDENQQLKKQLSTEQQRYSKTFRKFITADSAINHFQLKKQQQLNQLLQELQYAKFLANYTSSATKNK